MEEQLLEEYQISITDAYQQMEMLPGKLSNVIGKYNQKIRAEIRRDENAIGSINDTFQSQKENIEAQKKLAFENAMSARSVIVDQLNDLRKEMSEVERSYQSDAARLIGKQSMGSALSQLFVQVRGKSEAASKKFESLYQRLVNQENNIYDEKIREANRTHDAQLGVASEEYYEEIQRENEKNAENLASILNEAKNEMESWDPEGLKEMYNRLLINAPVTVNYEAAKEIPEAVEIGWIRIDLDQWDKDSLNEPVLELVREYFSYALRTEYGNSCLLLPFGQSFKDERINKLVSYDMSSRDISLEYIRALEMRMFMSIPCGKLRVTMIDPVDSGSNFSMFSCLGDDDERIISTRIWCDSDRIKERLGLLISQIEHVNQDCLRNEYDDIVDYNIAVGKNAEPLQALFIADFPKRFDQESCEMLEKIVSSGPKCGIYTFITGSVSEIDNSKFDIRGVLNGVQEIKCKNQQFTYSYGSRTQTMNEIALPEKEEQPEIFETLINGIKTSDRIIIYFDEIADELTKHKEKWFKFDDSNGIDVPVGLEGASRTVQIHLGGELITQHHALISGTIGSGKSTLLHTIIMSILLRYSPEDVQIYLLDFKRGVEFKVYAESKLPNFRVISLDTEPEFGLAVLQSLEQEQAERAQEFHDKGCDNIERYNELAEADPYDDIYKIPRIVVIVDEFHEMFANTDSTITKECERLLEQVVRQGRAMGIHVILASQTLPDNLARIYGQIMNRVALQSTASSAQYILDSNNDIIDKLVNVDPGKGVFNDGGGNRDANHEFRVALFREDEQRQLLDEILQQQEICEQDGLFGEFGFEKPRLLLSSIQDDNENPLNRFVETGEIPRRMEFGCPLYLGEEIAMINEFGVRLTSRRAQNLLILGADQKRAALLYGFSAMSILFNAFRRNNNMLPEQPVITFFDFGKNPSLNRRITRSNFDIMNELSARFPQAIRVFSRESLMDGIEILQREYEQNAGMKDNHYVIFAGLNRARRLLDTDRAYAMPPKKIFENLVKFGPENGYNYIIWANEPSGFCNFYGELLPEFDYRLVYDLKEEEYETVIKSSAMDTAFNNNVISYNPDEDNKKVRIYSMPLLGWISKFMERLEGVQTFAEEDWGEGEFGDDF